MDVSTGVVLAAGEGTRLRPLTHNRPKTMLPAADRPILEHVLDVLVEAGIERLCLVVGYQRERVQEHFGHAYRDVPISYVHQEKQLGSGHALQQVDDDIEAPVLVLNGDRVIDEKIVDDTLSAFDGRPTVAVLEHPTPSEYGAAEIDGDRLVELVEKPDSDGYRLINAGVYAFGTEVFDAIERTPRRGGELQLPDVIGTLMDGGEVRAAKTDGLWIDATYPWDLLYLTRKLLDEGRVGLNEREDESGVWVADSARIHDDATLQAPVVVGPDAEIAAGTVLGPDVVVGRNATVGANATIEDALVDADTRIGPGSTPALCVARQSATSGAGTGGPGGTGEGGGGGV
jgi:glucose-1-phosphate thymidylyltransferase